MHCYFIARCTLITQVAALAPVSC